MGSQNAGSQGNSAGKSVGNDWEIPGKPGNTATSTALPKVDPITAAKDRLMKYANHSCLGGLRGDDELFGADLCEEHTYARVVEILALPRPAGLDLKTSISSVQRFYANYRSRDMQEEEEISSSAPSASSAVKLRTLASGNVPCHVTVH